jgi:FlaA1/EpsC-like NDP-sugar epimerase
MSAHRGHFSPASTGRRCWSLAPSPQRLFIGFVEAVGRHPGRTVRTFDISVWVGTIALGTLVRYSWEPPVAAITGTVILAGLAVTLVLIAGYVNGVHRLRYVIGSTDETIALGSLSLAVGAGLLIANQIFRPHLVPLSVALFVPFAAAVCCLTPRLAYRVTMDGFRSPDPSRCRRVIVFGAGDAGRQIVQALLHQEQSEFLPIAFVDDDPNKQNLTVYGVPVLGTRADLAGLASALRADTLLVAVPSAEPDLKQQLASDAAQCGLDVRILPPVWQLIESTVNVKDIRDVSEEDLLGRPQIDIDVEGIADYLSGKCVLVTGAGGSIGSEICRQVARFGPKRLVMLDRDESALHAVQLSIEGRALLTDDDVIVADIRDAARIQEVLSAVRCHVIFHAAALKHLPLLELHPQEALKTNVWGTRNLLEAARLAECSRFVNISTDKAADPVSVLGYTKHLGERMTAGIAEHSDGTYLSVRFGNVLGSRGSVLPTFRRQIESGGPVTVTHPEVTRYFMTIEEAVRLVIQAGAVGQSGEVLILDMGSPVRIADVARRLIARSGAKVEIEYTGLRPGEKLHEHLLGARETPLTRSHPSILHTRVPPMYLADLHALTPENLAALATSDHPSLEVGTVKGWRTNDASVGMFARAEAER